MHFSNFSNLPSVVFMLLIVIACATGEKTLFGCPNPHFGYCAFEDLGTTPINYAFGPAHTPSPWNSNLMTCQHSQLPFGIPQNTCCDQSVGQVHYRPRDDPLIVWYDDYVKYGCRKVPNTN
ncbi:hypothetical protein PGTUg99_015072 [Puccinia graminis f. sp. tritici]|uniref:Secreted protein n=1 Tax=Puccinia graminis f. sp. tritici TaxID=56615 RepID=A0A5B0MSH0_PUCGR|nr:hypothetical protein PGTUg99_015072 [Puccinia graminis f. sp. tritici]